MRERFVRVDGRHATFDARARMSTVVAWTALHFEGRALGFTTEGGDLIVMHEGSLFVVDVRDGRREVLAHGIADGGRGVGGGGAVGAGAGGADGFARGGVRVLGAAARDRRRVVIWDERGVISVVERGVTPSVGARALPCPPSFRPTSGLSASGLSPSGRFFAAGGHVGEAREWRLAFFDLDATDATASHATDATALDATHEAPLDATREGPVAATEATPLDATEATTLDATDALPWIVDDENVRGVRFWKGDVAVVDGGRECEPALRRSSHAPEVRLPRGRVSPRGTRGVTLEAGALVIEGDEGVRTIPFTLDSSDELGWIDEGFLVHASTPFAVVDVERERVHRFDPAEGARGRLLVARDGRRVAWTAQGWTTIGDLLLREPPRCVIEPGDALAPPLPFDRVEAERLAMQLAERAYAWGIELIPTVHWQEGSPEDAERAEPWERPISDVLRETHAMRDGHRTIFEVLAPVCAELERRDETGRRTSRMLLLDGDVRSAAALDLRIVRGPRARTPIATLPSPFEPAIRLARMGVVVLDVGAGGVRLLRVT